MKLRVTLTVEEATAALSDKFAQQESEFFGKDVEVIIVPQVKIRFDKIAAIKELRHAVENSSMIEPRARSAGGYSNGGTYSGFYISLVAAKTLIERIMEQAIK